MDRLYQPDDIFSRMGDVELLVELHRPAVGHDPRAAALIQRFLDARLDRRNTQPILDQMWEYARA
jgi:hypothetical protein